MVFTDKDRSKLKIAMIKKYGKTSYKQLGDELGVSRIAIYTAINNEGSLDKLRERIVEWTKNNN